MHLTETELQMLVDGELRGRRREGAERHLERCSACAAALARLEAHERSTAMALRTIDRAPPSVSVDLLIARAEARRRPRWEALAAGVAALVVAAAGAAAVLPHSVLRSYLGLSTHAPRAISQAPDVAASSVGFAPARVVSVSFMSPQETGEIAIVLSDGPMVRVAHRGGSPSYTLTTDGVLVANEGSRASYEVSVPRSAPVVRVRVGREVVFTRDGGHVAAVATPDQTGRYVIHFAALARGNDQ